VEGVLDEKLNLLRGLPADGLAVVGDEPALLEEKARDVATNLLVAGWSGRANPENRPEAPEVLDNGSYRFRWRGETVTLSTPGRHSVQNALIALAVADALGVSPGEAASRVGLVVPSGMRSELRTLGGLTLLVDCYNANPQSLEAALDLVTTLPCSGIRIAVLGSMLELGEDSSAIHRRALRQALTYPVNTVIATGLFAEAAEALGPPPLDGPEVVVAPDLADAGTLLLDRLEGTEVVLLKASRGVAMEALIPALEKRFGEGSSA
jgi:UDP-N-acetylmuramoyl-tripeptide--D-alanyl-D-alanine ligase